MNVTTQVVINKPRQVVVNLIGDPANLAYWQPEVKNVQPLAGAPNQVGSRSRVTIEVRGFRLEMVETIIDYHPPVSFSSQYEARGIKNLVTNRFFEEGPEITRWVLSSQFRFSGLMSFAGVFLQGIVPEQTAESMERFKQFAEST